MNKSLNKLSDLYPWVKRKIRLQIFQDFKEFRMSLVQTPTPNTYPQCVQQCIPVITQNPGGENVRNSEVLMNF